jgi:hypothetical protein
MERVVIRVVHMDVQPVIYVSPWYERDSLSHITQKPYILCANSKVEHRSFLHGRLLLCFKIVAHIVRKQRPKTIDTYRPK